MSVNTLEIHVDDIANTLLSFNVMRIRKSDAELGPWTEITAAADAPAILTGSTTGPFDVVGKTLRFQVDREEEALVTFTGAAPLTIGQVVSQIDAVSAGIASESVGALQLESTLSGTLSRMLVVSGTAVTDLGFTDGDLDVGEDEYIILSSGTSLYNFSDQDGGDYYYQAAFYHTSTYLISEWSTAFQAIPGTAISAEELSIGSMDLVDATGTTVAEQRITFYPSYDALAVEGFSVGLVRQPITAVTDNSGHAEMTLVRGLKGRMVLEGTNMIREITVPDTATFDIMALMASAPDPWSPSTPDYPYAIRRTL